MMHYMGKYKPIHVEIKLYRNSLVKRAVSIINRIAEQKYNGENMRFVNQMQPETDFCQDSMLVDEVMEDGIMRVLKRIEPYFVFMERTNENDGEGETGGIDVSPSQLEFSYLGGSKTFAVTTRNGSVLDVEPDNLGFEWTGGTKTFLVKTDGGQEGDVSTRLDLQFPYNWKRQFDAVLRKFVCEYVVHHVVATWLEMVSPEDAQRYLLKQDEILRNVKGTCEMRQGRVHVGWNTTY